MVSLLTFIRHFDGLLPDSLVVFASQDAGGYAISRQCHTCMLIELFYIGMPLVRAGGQVDA